MDPERKRKLERVVFVGLVAVFLLGLMNMLKGSHRSPARPRPISSAPALAPKAVAPGPSHGTPAPSWTRSGGSGLPEGAIGTRIQYTAEDFRDPLVSLLPNPKQDSRAALATEEQAVKPPPTAPMLMIQGMLWGGQRPQVLIDGKLYEVGDTVQGSQIVEIGREGVAVVNQGATFVLRPPAMANTATDRSASMGMERGR